MSTVIVGDGAAAGTLTVTGSNTLVKLTGDVQVGNSSTATGTINITNGGKLTVGAANGVELFGGTGNALASLNVTAATTSARRCVARQGCG